MTTSQSSHPVHVLACAGYKQRAWYHRWQADTAPKHGGRIRTCQHCGAHVYESGPSDGACPGCGR